MLRKAQECATYFVILKERAKIICVIPKADYCWSCSRRTVISFLIHVVDKLIALFQEVMCDVVQILQLGSGKDHREDYAILALGLMTYVHETLAGIEADMTEPEEMVGIPSHDNQKCNTDFLEIRCNSTLDLCAREYRLHPHTR